MAKREDLLLKYIDKEAIDQLTSHHRTSKDIILKVFRAAAADALAGKITFDDFSLVAMNLYFEGYKHYDPKKLDVPEAVVEALEAFSDPHGKEEFSEKMQISLLKKALESL